MALILSFCFAFLLMPQSALSWVYHPFQLQSSPSDNTNDDSQCRSPQLAEPIVTPSQLVEESETVVFSIMKPRKTYGVVRYKFRTKNGTAGSQDYVPKEGTITFHRFDTHKEVRVETLRDHIAEETETFELELYDPEVNWSPQWNYWHTPYQPCPSQWVEGFDRLPRTRAITASIVDPSGTSYEDQKYGEGYEGQTFGE